MIWDRGRWIPEGDPHKGYAKGHLVFDLDGEKLHGRWHLVRMRARETNERHENWLLIKGKDEEARGPRDEDILEEKPRSVATGRSIEEIAAGKGGKKRVWHSNRAAERRRNRRRVQAKDQKLAARPAARPRAKSEAGARSADSKRGKTRGAGATASPLPDFVPLSLATLYDQAPSGPEWLHEIKFDGYRMEARLDHGKVRLLTRKRAGLDAPLQAGRRGGCRAARRDRAPRRRSGGGRRQRHQRIFRCCRPI